MDFSVFFYTYSTTAQALAGAFGFMVAAVLYRLSTYAATEVQWMKTLTDASVPIRDAEKRRKDNEYMINTFVKPFYSEYENVKLDLIHSLYWTGGTIIACLVLIPAQPPLWWVSRETGRRMKWTTPIDQWLLWLAVFAVVGAAIYTISTYFPLVRGVVKLTHRQPVQEEAKQT